MLWTFENYRLDTDNATLSRDGKPVVLRPKTFDVLQFLVERGGELVRKEALLEAIWKNSYVVEGVLTTSMSELRKLFGDTAKNQRYIATVYRRGYRFIATVNELETAGALNNALSASAAPEQDIPGDISRFPNPRSLVGREKECEGLINQLTSDADCRILSLVGPGGIGKTHLAVTVARQMAQSNSHPFDDGFCFARLQSLEKADEFCSVIVDALGLQSGGEETPQIHLQNFLSNKRMLLVIDNFEYYLDLRHVLTELISAAPEIKILVTSRESLNIPDAWFHPVNGLAFDKSIDSDAVRLFTYLAQRNQPEFDIDEKLPIVLQICEMVEGMPLALELAAGWLRMLSMDEVAAEITEGIDILADQHGDGSERHSSVRAVFNETWQRLTESERTLLKQISIFRGGTDREAIREITGASLPILARLVNKALLYTTSQLRYQMHELIRQYSEEELKADRALETETRNQHARHYLGFMENQYEPLCSDQQGIACQAIQVEFDNIRTAWYWAVSQRQFEWLQGSIRIVSYFSDLRGHFHEGLAMFEAAQTAIESSDHPHKQLLAGKIKMRAGILNFRLSRYDTALALFNEIRQIPGLEFEQSYVLRYLGDYHFSLSGFFTAEESKKFLDECIEQGDRFGNSHTRIECLIQFAFLYTNQIVDIELSQQYATQAVELARENSSPDVLAYALDVLAWTTNHRGDYAEAEALWLEALKIANKAGNRRNIALVTNWLGWSAWSVGEARLDEAARLFTDGLNSYRDLGDRANMSMSYADLALVLLEQGELDPAREYCQQGMELAGEIGRDDHYVYNLFVLGAVECAAGNLALARSHLARALTLAWEQEEQTNKPVVVFYVLQLLYAEYRDNAGDAGSVALKNIVTVLLFLQIYPATWQAFKDRARQFQQSIESEIGDKPFAAIKKLSNKKLTDTALKLIPALLT